MSPIRTRPGETGTRQRILEVSARLFAERGYADTSVRDIAAELNIANPSLYYHFRSKGDILAELLTEPLRRVEIAVADADRLTGDDKTRRIIAGLLDALEVHSGIVIAALHRREELPGPYRELAAAMQPVVVRLLGEGVAEDYRDLRVAMAVGAVEGAVTEMMRASADSDTFVTQLRAARSPIIELLLRILR